MDINTQKKLLTWMVIILVIINISVIGWLVYNNYQMRNSFPNNTFRSQNNNNQGANFRQNPGHYLGQKFNFNTAQQETLQSLSSEHRLKIAPLRDSIQVCRRTMIEEITKDQPDEEFMNTCASKIGNYHKQMNKLTIEHFMEIKQLATPEQEQEINHFLENAAQRHSKGHYHSQHPRHRPMSRGQGRK